MEEQLNYRFKYPELVEQAFTHISLVNRHQNFEEVNQDYENYKKQVEHINREEERSNHLSYERLEFLGDAVLDSIVVEWLVKEFPNNNPGELSLKKQCIVCNKALALVSVKYKYYQFIEHGQEDNQQKFEEIIRNIEENYEKYHRDIGQLYNNEPMVKILGDIFESLVGAIFLDSGFNYAETKRIVLHLLEKDFIRHFSSPAFLIKHPQDKLNTIFQKNNILSPKIVLNEDELPLNGEYEY